MHRRTAIGISAALVLGATHLSAQPTGSLDPRCLGSEPTQLVAGGALVVLHLWSDDYAGVIEPWAQIVDGEVYPVGDGSMLMEVDTIIDLSDGSVHVVADRSADYIEATGRCWWRARALETQPGDAVVFATMALDIGVEVDDSVQAALLELEPTCEGIYPDDFLARFPNIEQRCYRPSVLAASDLNLNGRREYWYRLILQGGTAWVIAEENGPAAPLATRVKLCSYFVC